MPLIMSSLVAVASFAIMILSMIEAGRMSIKTGHSFRFSVVTAGGLSCWAFSKTCGLALNDFANTNWPVVLSATILAAFLFFSHRVKI